MKTVYHTDIESNASVNTKDEASQLKPVTWLSLIPLKRIAMNLPQNSDMITLITKILPMDHLPTSWLEVCLTGQTVPLHRAMGEEASYSIYLGPQVPGTSIHGMPTPGAI